MVPISKSIWPLILFVYANFYFAAITRFNSSFCFSKIFSRERSSSPPPNFAPSFCALCLNVCDFLPKTWNLGRKSPLSAASSPSQALPRQLSQRESPWHNGKLSGVSANLPVPPEPLPLGEVDANAVSRRRGRGRSPAARLFPQETSAAAAVCLYDPSREKGVQKRPQAFLYPKI